MSRHDRRAGASPPRTAELLLRWLLPPGGVGDSILGDLRQEYAERAEGPSGERRTQASNARGTASDLCTKLWYWRQALSIGTRYGASGLLARLAAPSAWSPLLALGRELRLGGRSLRRRPLLLITATAAFAIGIGSATTLLVVADTMIWRALPYPDAEHLVQVGGTWRSGSGISPLAPPMADDWIAESRSFASIGAALRVDLDLTGGARPGAERFEGAAVTPGLGSVLGTRTPLGRWLLPEDDRPGARRVVVLSDAVWRSRWGADPTLVGRTLLLDGEPTTVVGVLERGFLPPEGIGLRRVEMYVPLEQAGIDRGSHANRFVRVLGRLAPETSLDTARLELQQLTDRLRASYPPDSYDEGFEVRAAGLHDLTLGDSGQVLLALLAAAALLFLIACANVANLLLLGARERRRELAIRRALGAGRGRLLSQLAAEVVALASVGGAAAAVVTIAGLGLFRRFAPENLPRLAEIGFDGRALALLAGVVVAATALSGAVPVFLSRRITAGAAGLSPSRQRVARDRSDRRARGTLIVIESALATMLLIGAGLLAVSFERLVSVEPGFETDAVTVVALELGNRYAAREQRLQAFGRASEELAAIPGVERVGLANGLPFSGAVAGGSVVIEGRSTDDAEEPEYFRWQLVDDGFLPVLGLDVLPGGRGLSSADVSRGDAVVLVNESFARRFWPDRRAVGQRIKVVRTGQEAPWLEVVGVVEDFHQGSLTRAASPEVFLPYTQSPVLFERMMFAVRSALPTEALVPSLEQAIWRVDPGQPIDWIAPMRARIGRTLVEPRFYALLFQGFAAAALALCALGIYGTVARSVSERRFELAVRLAVGATGRQVGARMLADLATTIGCGLLIGELGALALSRTLRSLLFEIEPSHPPVYVAAALLLGAAALAAAGRPALLATRVAPSRWLRAE